MSAKWELNSISLKVDLFLPDNKTSLTDWWWMQYVLLKKEPRLSSATVFGAQQIFRHGDPAAMVSVHTIVLKTNKALLNTPVSVTMHCDTVRPFSSGILIVSVTFNSALRNGEFLFENICIICGIALHLNSKSGPITNSL